MNSKQKHSDIINNKVRIFISHSSKDEDITQALVELLESSFELQQNDIRCTSLSGYKLPTGAHTSIKLKDEIKNSDIVIGVITLNSIGSHYVLFELGASWGLDISTFPVIAKGVDFDSLPGPLKEKHAIHRTVIS